MQKCWRKEALFLPVTARNPIRHHLHLTPGASRPGSSLGVLGPEVSCNPSHGQELQGRYGWMTFLEQTPPPWAESRSAAVGQATPWLLSEHLACVTTSCLHGPPFYVYLSLNPRQRPEHSMAPLMELAAAVAAIASGCATAAPSTELDALCLPVSRPSKEVNMLTGRGVRTRAASGG